MWTPTTRVQHSRSGLRYGSDVTDTEWLLLFSRFDGFASKPILAHP